MNLQIILFYFLSVCIHNALGFVSWRNPYSKTTDICPLRSLATCRIVQMRAIDIRRPSEVSLEKSELCESLRMARLWTCVRRDGGGAWCLWCWWPGNVRYHPPCRWGLVSLCKGLKCDSSHQDLTALNGKPVLVSCTKFGCQCGDNNVTKASRNLVSNTVNDPASGIVSSISTESKNEATHSELEVLNINSFNSAEHYFNRNYFLTTSKSTDKSEISIRFEDILQIKKDKPLASTKRDIVVKSDDIRTTNEAIFLQESVKRRRIDFPAISEVGEDFITETNYDKSFKTYPGNSILMKETKTDVERTTEISSLDVTENNQKSDTKAENKLAEELNITTTSGVSTYSNVEKCIANSYMTFNSSVSKESWKVSVDSDMRTATANILAHRTCDSRYCDPMECYFEGHCYFLHRLLEQEELIGVATDDMCGKLKRGAHGVAAGTDSEIAFVIMFLENVHDTTGRVLTSGKRRCCSCSDRDGRWLSWAVTMDQTLLNITGNVECCCLLARCYVIAWEDDEVSWNFWSSKNSKLSDRETTDSNIFPRPSHIICERLSQTSNILSANLRSYITSIPTHSIKVSFMPLEARKFDDTTSEKFQIPRGITSSIIYSPENVETQENADNFSGNYVFDNPTRHISRNLETKEVHGSVISNNDEVTTETIISNEKTSVNLAKEDPRNKVVINGPFSPNQNVHTTAVTAESGNSPSSFSDGAEITFTSNVTFEQPDEYFSNTNITTITSNKNPPARTTTQDMDFSVSYTNDTTKIVPTTQNPNINSDTGDTDGNYFSNNTWNTETINSTESTSTNKNEYIPNVSDSLNTTDVTDVSITWNNTNEPCDDVSSSTTSTTSTTSAPSGCENVCSGMDQYGYTWTGCPGSTVSLPCPNGALGEARWYCNTESSIFDGEMPDYSNCTHMWLEEIEEEISERKDAIRIASSINTRSDHTSFFGHELPDVLDILNNTFDLHMQQVIREHPEVRFNKSAIFTSSAAGIVDTLLTSKLGLLQLEESQRVSLGLVLTSLSTSVGFTLASMAADLGEDVKYNATFNSNNDSVLLFGVDVFNTNSSVQKFIFPPDANTLQSRIIVDTGVRGAFRRPRSVGMVLDSEPASLIFPPSRNNLKDVKNATKVLNSVLLSYSLEDLNDDVVISVEQFPFRSTGSPVQVSLEHVMVAKGPEETVVRRHLHPGETPTAVMGSARCVYWNVAIGPSLQNRELPFKNTTTEQATDSRECEAGLWDEAGCRVESSDETHTLCICNHLSTFAILMDVHDYVGKDTALEVLSWTCSGASVLCLLLTLLVFQGCRSIQGERTSIGKNLCFCLVIGHVVCLFFLDKSYFNLSEVICSLVAGSLHYFFLASFCWMTVEGHHLYRMVVKVFDSGRDYRRWYFLLSYGFPAFVVTLTKVVALVRDDKAYGREELCWLSSPFYIWSFIGPVLLLSTINATVLVMALREAVSAGLSQGKSKRETVWIWIRGWFSLSTLLGITWLFGLAYMEFNHSLVYIFVILNGCQGVFIFLFRCVLNEQVRNSFVSSMKGDGFVVLLLGRVYRRSSWNLDSPRSDGSRNTSITASGQCDSVQDEGDGHPLWYVLTHCTQNRPLQEAVNSCDLLQTRIKGVSRPGSTDGGVISNCSLADEAQSQESRAISNSGPWKESNNPCTRPAINVTNTEVDTSFFGGGNWRLSEDTDERLGLSVFTGPCWSLLRSGRHVSVTRYPTIDEESDPDC